MELLSLSLLCVFLFLILLSWALTKLFRNYALANGFMDVPNQRSSHSVPTPSGGGVAIVVTFISGLVLLWYMSLVNDKVFMVLLGGALLISFIGFIDDCVQVSVRWRLLFHFVAALWVVFFLGALPSLFTLGLEIDFGWASSVFTVIGLMWLLNLYNFMDGIDGIASMEALSIVLVAGLIMWFFIGHQATTLLLLLTFVSVVGFFIWNFPHAKVFMGDVGSGFLGWLLGALALYSTHIDHRMFWVWLILLGVFIVDATYTLLHRFMSGEKIYQSHCSHAYQTASRKYGSHIAITMSILIINLFWLTPWSIAVISNVVDGGLALLLSYIPLVWLSWYFREAEAR